MQIAYYCPFCGSVLSYEYKDSCDMIAKKHMEGCASHPYYALQVEINRLHLMTSGTQHMKRVLTRTCETLQDVVKDMKGEL